MSRFASLPPRALLALATVATTLAAGSAPHAQDASYNLEVSERFAAPALQAVARQTGARIIFSPEQLRWVQTPPIAGKLTAQEAVSRLLAGTAFTFVVSQRGVIIVTRDDRRRT